MCDTVTEQFKNVYSCFNFVMNIVKSLYADVYKNDKI